MPAQELDTRSGGVEMNNTADLAIIEDVGITTEQYAVLNQEVELDINFRERAISGISTIWLQNWDNELDEIAMDARQCEIDLNNIQVDGIKTNATYRDPLEAMRVPRQWQLAAVNYKIMQRRMKDAQPAKRPDYPVRQRFGAIPCDGALLISLKPTIPAPDESRRIVKLKTKPDNRARADRMDNGDEMTGTKISIPFRTTAIRDGLHFVGVDESDERYTHVYTRHSIEPGTASSIFPCMDDPTYRHNWKISIKFPRTMGHALEQPPAPIPELGNAFERIVDRTRRRGREEPEGAPPIPLDEKDRQLDMTVICSGILVGEQVDPNDDGKRIMSFQCDNTSANHIGFAVGPFEHVDLWSDFRTEESDEKLGAAATQIYAYCLPGRADEIRNTCAPVVAAADYFALELGRNPFDSYKLCFVEDMVADVVPAASLSLCSIRLLYPEDMIDPEIDITRQLVHSVACQYFGIRIVPNQRTDSWIVIGAQWFVTDLFMKTLCGQNWYKFHLKTWCDKLVEADVNRPSIRDLGSYLHVGDFERDFMKLKAPMVMYALDQRMSKYAGSTGVVRTLSQIISSANIDSTKVDYTSITEDDFFTLCGRRSQYRMDRFREEYVASASLPCLRIKQKFNKKSLNVEITVEQEKTQETRSITVDGFWRAYQEVIHKVPVGEVPKHFTGPFTVRIHEADGTPYEHYLEVREDDRLHGAPWLIPYNTKYKRLKKSKRRDGAGTATSAANLAKQDMQDDDVVYFNMLGDVLVSPEDRENWGLEEWDETVQRAMDQESYEWIRYDCNFEWLAKITSDMPGYMYLAQLQQDRDVIAHQEAMLFFTRLPRHSMSATVETRTLMDPRYFHGIRAMAAADLPKQAVEELNYCGEQQLIKAYRTLFCHRILGKSGGETWPPKANDFSNKAQYAVQCAVLDAIARTRANGRCSSKARNFVLELVLFNDNSNNKYSDHVFICKLLGALTTSLIPDKTVANAERPDDGVLFPSLGMDDDGDVEFKGFLEKAIEVIDKYRRMDEWTYTHQNIWTTTSLDCKMRLMKNKIIPVDALEFLQYCQDENLDLVRIKAFECLVELHMISYPAILRLLLFAMSTDNSPFVRDRLFKSFCKGVAAIAVGAHKWSARSPGANAQADVDDVEMVDNDGDLIIEAGETEMQRRKLDAVRKTDIHQSLAALKEEVQGSVELQKGLWKAFMSSTPSFREKQSILDLCAAMFEFDESLVVTLNYPVSYTCTREPRNKVGAGAASGSKSKRTCFVSFKRHYRTRSRLSMAPPPGRLSISIPALASQPPEAPASVVDKPTISTTRIKIRHSISSTPVLAGPANPLAPVHRPSVSFKAPAPTMGTATPASDHIIRPNLQQLATIAAAAAVSPTDHVNGTGAATKDKAKAPKKHKGEDDDGIEHPTKKAKGATGAARPKGIKIKIVKLTTDSARLRGILARRDGVSLVAATLNPRANGLISGHVSTASLPALAAGSPSSATLTRGSSFQSAVTGSALTPHVTGPYSGGAPKQRKPLPTGPPVGTPSSVCVNIAAASAARVNRFAALSATPSSAATQSKRITLKLKKPSATST